MSDIVQRGQRSYQILEDNIQKPLKFEPKPPSADSLQVLEKIIGVAVQGNMMNDTDADRIMKILKGDFKERIARLGQRITLVEKTADEIATLDDRLKRNAEYLRAEFDILAQFLDKPPSWEGDESRA